MRDFSGARQAELVYDGQCPFCARYVKLLRIREQLSLQLIDAREGGEVVQAIVERGYDLNEGLALRIGGEIYHGDECMQVLAMLSTPISAFNRLNRWVFLQPSLARIVYPILRAGRNLTLRLLGRSNLDPQHATKPAAQDP